MRNSSRWRPWAKSRGLASSTSYFAISQWSPTWHSRRRRWGGARRARPPMGFARRRPEAWSATSYFEHDLRISLDRLAGIPRDQFGEEPCSGAPFFFTNKASDRCKILFCDRTGYWFRCKGSTRARSNCRSRRTPRSFVVAIESEAFARLREGVADPPARVRRTLGSSAMNRLRRAPHSHHRCRAEFASRA